MGIFGSSKGATQQKKEKSKRIMSDQINLVGEGTTFEGTLSAQSDVRASGRIVGTLEVDGRAIIAESGHVEGEIIATNADIAGEVKGEVHIAERLILKSAARVDGTIYTKRLVVEEGAVFTGQCVMDEHDSNKAMQSKAAQQETANKKTSSSKSTSTKSGGSTSSKPSSKKKSG